MSESGQEIEAVNNGKVRMEKGKNRLIFSDNEVSRMLLGMDTDGIIRGKLSQEGIDVFDATGDQLIWSTDFNSFKIVDVLVIESADVTTVADGTNTYSGGVTTSEPHGLSYRPLLMAFVEVSADQYTLMPYSEVVSASSPSGGIQSTIYRATATATNVSIFHYVVTYSPGIGAGTYSGARIVCFLLRETAS